MSADDSEKTLTAPSQGGDLLAWVREQIGYSEARRAAADFASGEAFHRGIVECLREVLAGLVPLVAERDELRAKVADAAVISVAFEHEFRAIAKALGLGPSATAGEIAETVGAVIAERDAFKRDAANLLEALENRPEPWETREADHAHGEAQARVRKLEAGRLWVMEGLRSSEARAGEPTDAEMEAAGAVTKRLLTAGEVNDLCRQVEGLTDALGITRRDREDPVHAARVLIESVKVDRARLADLEAERRWVPVSEQMPAKAVWVVRPDGKRIGEAHIFDRNGRRMWATPGGTFDFVGDELWQPLPADPEVQP